jgi:hypothetical protein
LQDKWIWDFWLARDGDDYHVFYLQAPKSLGDPSARHHNATIDEFLAGDPHGSRYAGKLIEDPDGQLVYLAFSQYPDGPRFLGELSDPIAIHVNDSGHLRLDE